MVLILYHREFCPYSKTVRQFIEEHHLENQIIYRDIENDFDALERLVRLTGGQQTPCLVIDGRPKLGEANIIQWLQDHLIAE